MKGLLYSVKIHNHTQVFSQKKKYSAGSNRIYLRSYLRWSSNSKRYLSMSHSEQAHQKRHRHFSAERLRWICSWLLLGSKTNGGRYTFPNGPRGEMMFNLVLCFCEDLVKLVRWGMCHNSTDIENSRHAHFNIVFRTKRKKSQVQKLFSLRPYALEITWVEFETYILPTRWSISSTRWGAKEKSFSKAVFHSWAVVGVCPGLGQAGDDALPGEEAETG